MKHTKGPWLASERLTFSENHKGWIIGPPGGWKVCEVYPGASDPTEEAAANASLIAAAPELLEALRECMDKACSTPGEWVPLATMRKMRSAIAKSQGAATPEQRETENAE
jgi:hypothetical protein